MSHKISELLQPFRKTLIICLAIWVALVTASVLAPRTTVFVSTSSSQLAYQAYLFDGSFREDNSITLKTPDFHQGHRSFETGVSFPLNNSTVFRFDIDPRTQGALSVAHLPAVPFSILPVVVTERSLLYTRHAWYHDSSIIVGHSGLEKNGALYHLVDYDAHVIIDLARGNPEIIAHLTWDALFCLLLLIFITLAIRGFLILLKTENTLALFGVAAVFSVVVGMCVSLGLAPGYAHGPDEVMHYPSYFWYQEHIYPPSVNDPVYLYPIWQSSYILGATGDLSYLLTARTDTLLSWLMPNLEPLISMRLAQLFLIITSIGVSILLFGISGGLACLVPWILTPQLSYTATYLNGDALSFSFGVLALGMLLIKAPKNGWWIIPALFILFNLKANYMVLVALLPLIWLLMPSARIRPQTSWILTTIACLPLILYRRLFNWFDERNAGLTYLQAAHQRLIEKTDTSIYPFSYARESYERRLSGISSFDWSILTDANWYALSFRSLFGIFGYMDFIM